MVCLISKDSKGKIRIALIDAIKNDNGTFTITRKTGQYGGKMTSQPDIIITKGKVKRTIEEQVELEYNSKVRKYLDKGYKEITMEQYNSPNFEDVANEIIGEVVTDSKGFKKHMKAKPYTDVSTSAINKISYWWLSRKIDGVRNSFYWDGFQIKTASRGGKDYDMAVRQMIQHPKLIEFFKKHPNYILDGELYKHGKSLEEISGAVRKEKASTDWLEYYIYDIMIPGIVFEERLKILEQIKEELNLSFDPNREWDENELKFQMVPHVKVTGWDNIKHLHDEYVNEGWEGCVIRDPNKEYKYGSRCNDMIKVKDYKDDCFKVIGIKGGLRGYIDMTFELITKDGVVFNASPFGSSEIKKEYWDNFEEKYKGQMGECKFFDYSDKGTPKQPKFKAFRFDLD